MTDDPIKLTPWDELEQIVDTQDSDQIELFLDSLPAGETARTIARMGQDTQIRLLELLPVEAAADLMETLTDYQAADVIEHLPAKQAAAIIDHMASDEQVDLLSELDDEDAQAILDRMSPEEAADVRRLTRYGPDTAGGLMITEFLAFPDHFHVDDVLQDLRRGIQRYVGYDVQYVYIVSGDDGKLCGVVRMRDLILSPDKSPITDIMIRSPHSVRVNADLDVLWDFFERHDFFAAPALDDQDRLVGVVRRGAVQEAVAERADKAMMRLGGIVAGEELRTMNTPFRAIRRLAFLGPNIGLNFISASVIAVFLPTLEQVASLMIFLPILSDMSGCSGNQAFAVSMRELSLGLIKPYELVRVLTKEVSVGLINGLVLGTVLGLVAWVIRGNPYLGVVVGVALGVNSVVAVSIGGTIPLILKRLRIDPALASGPLLTTFTDLCGFLLALGMASLLLPMLKA